MKALFSFLLIGLFLQLKAQNYFNETAEWKQHFYYQNSMSNTACNYRIYFDGDSIHNGSSYRKLFTESECILSQMQWDSLGNSFWVSDTTYSTYFTTLLRESDKKVFLIDGQGTEYLRYNFGKPNYTPIDSVDFSYSCGFETSVQIEQHDTVCIGPIGRKRWHVSWSQYPNASHFIEGVGPTSGFLAPVCRNGCPECGWGLDSFVLNGDTLYQGVCSIPAYTSEILHTEPVIIQTREHIDIRYPDLQTMQFYSSSGKLAGAVQSNEKDRVVFDTTGLSAGIYIYFSRVKNSNIRGKFIVVNEDR